MTQSLPIDVLKNEVLEHALNTHLVIEAETGSGKSTRLPLWLSELGRVLVIQPRRIACTSLSGYLAANKGESVGQSIGYAIKLENHFDESTDVVFCTPGVALRWFEDHRLDSFDYIIMDEFHERRWDMDILLAMLKKEGNHRLIVTSATLSSSFLSTYLNARKLSASGRQFHVQVHYESHDAHHLPSSRNIEEGVVHALMKYWGGLQGDVLVFLPGRKEIQQCHAKLKSLFPDVLITPLHASVTDGERERALQTQASRKIVLATNVAETSLTIPNIHCVIDTGLERRTIQRNGRTTLMLTHISKASSKQRAGRAGRIMDGLCVRLYGEHAPLIEQTPPELLREALTEAMMATAACDFHLSQLLSDLTPLLHSYPEKSLNDAFTLLSSVGAIDSQGNILPSGKTMASLPVDALHAYLIVSMQTKASKEAMVDLAAALSVPATLYKLPTNEETQEALKQSEPLQCDGELLIRLVRNKRVEGLVIEHDAVEEARGIAAQMRAHFELPELSVASRYDRNALLSDVMSAYPDFVFVRREGRRSDTLTNGKMEVIPAKNSRLLDTANAALVLDIHSLPGRCVKQTLNLATVMLPVSFSLLQENDFGEWEQGETVMPSSAASRGLPSTGSIVEGSPLTLLELTYAGRVIATQHVKAEGKLALKPILEAIKSEECLVGFARKRQDEIGHFKLYVALGLHDTVKVVPDIDFDTWFMEQLELLELSSMDELALFTAEDFPFDGIPYWEYSDFSEKYPYQLFLGDVILSVEYFPLKKLIHVVYQKGLRKGEPKRWELPKWVGWRIQYKKASRIIDIR
ncbi:helicase-related protein [Vibrio sp.]|nr:helicase-related protein [Vibrio sp.]